MALDHSTEIRIVEREFVRKRIPFACRYVAELSKRQANESFLIGMADGIRRHAGTGIARSINLHSFVLRE
jgi:methyl coenzyme M reductase subunit C-like uncharacterized protein (methanogenesis marker protein 7)